MLDAPIDTSEIVVTAAREPQQAGENAASVTVIDRQRIERLGEPLVPALLRLTPSAAVATSGPAGSFTELRIRGAENNHSLLFVDGIRVNDPATGNQPRYELLNADLASRVEVVRGPQSALWGSEAIGGVIAVDGADGISPVLAALGEAGSLGFRRIGASSALGAGPAKLEIAAGWQRATGIDSFDGSGDRDGYRNVSGRLRAGWRLSPAIELGAAALALTGESEFDGFDPLTFLHADTLDSSRNRLLAGRLWSRFGADQSAWSGRLEAVLLGSRNRNLLDDEEINRARGRRRTIGGQVEHGFATGPVSHRLIAALELEREQFRARDTAFGGFTRQDRSRSHQSLTFEWRAEAHALVADVAVRRDRFNRFEDSTTVRASLLARVGGGFALAASYGEGIAQPTFYDLYGFFPGNFVGNPSLQPESSRGFEASIRYSGEHLRAALTWHRQRLRDEIVDVFDPDTFLSTTVNRDEDSRRSGIEAEIGWRLGDALRFTGHYALLAASEPASAGNRPLREVRRPRHSGSAAVDGERGRLTYGATLAYTGARRDMNFDVFPAERVRLGGYWLAGARVGYQLGRGIELFARAANAFDADYQDAFGYRTEGRSLHAGLRLARRR